MINIEAVFYEKIKKIITSWYEDEIYAISFFVNSNEAYSFRGFSNVSNFSVSYNTEEDCDYADDLDEGIRMVRHRSHKTSKPKR